MHFAFAIVSLFPGGGLQRDCIDIARRVRKLGHEVTIFTSRVSDAEFTKDLPLRVLTVGKSNTNHGRQRAFSEEFKKVASGKFDLLVGFDKLSGLDVLYCSDRSMYARTARYPLLRLLPRYSEFIALEKESFAPHQKTTILLLSDNQFNEYWTAWTTEPSRLIMLPPTVASKRRRPGYRTDGTRDEWRARLGVIANELIWISIGVQPHTKGLDRSIYALRRFNDVRLLIVGIDETEARTAKHRRLARELGVADRIMWLGHREDVPELMAAADIFVHPARYDTTGTVILEAIINGLPVITTSACGYANHVGAGKTGLVINEPFKQKALIAALETARDPVVREQWSKSGLEYGAQKLLYEGKSRATELIIKQGTQGKTAEYHRAYSPPP